MKHWTPGKSWLLLILTTDFFYLTRAFRCRIPQVSKSRDSSSDSDSLSLRTESFVFHQQRHVSLSKPSVEGERDNIFLDTYATTTQSDLCHRHLTSYTLHWDNLLQREYQENLLEMQRRRKSYTNSQLEASGLVLFHAVASLESELFR